MSELQVRGLDFTISGNKILEQITADVKEGEFVGLIGPNGCGKSTLLKNIYKVFRPDCGEIRLGSLDALHTSSAALAKELAVMVQENSVEFDMPVIEMVLLGRYVHRRHFQDTSREDMAIARKYLAEVGLPDFEVFQCPLRLKQRLRDNWESGANPERSGHCERRRIRTA